MGTVLLGFVLFFIVLSPRTGAAPDPKNAKRSDDKVAVQDPHSKQKQGDGEWFPDPERGWIRLQERQSKAREDQHNRSNTTVKDQSDRTRWEY